MIIYVVRLHSHSSFSLPYYYRLRIYRNWYTVCTTLTKYIYLTQLEMLLWHVIHENNLGKESVSQYMSHFIELPLWFSLRFCSILFYGIENNGYNFNVWNFCLKKRDSVTSDWNTRRDGCVKRFTLNDPEGLEFIRVDVYGRETGVLTYSRV